MKAIAKFRKDLTAGHVCLGAYITLLDPLVCDALGDSVDFFWIDMEHTSMSAAALNGHLLAARARSVPVLVRVRGSQTPFIKFVLDAGADGIIVPQVVSAEEVSHVVSDCRYPPVGRRGYGPKIHSNYGRDNEDREYVERANKNVFVVAQIENLEALEAIDDIVAVAGLDSVVLGPWDLSASLGMLGEVEHPRVLDAMQTIISKARDAGLFVGAGLGPDPDYACLMAKYGVQWMGIGGDYSYLINYVDQTFSSIRTRLGETTEAEQQS